MIFNLPFQIVICHLVLVITATLFSSSVKLGYSDTPGVVSLRINHVLPSLHKESSIKNRFRYSAPRSWSNIKNTVVMTIVTFQHIQCLHLMYAEVAWVLVSSGTQVQPQIILDPDYLPDYLFVSDDYEITMITRQMTPFFLSVGIFHFCISRSSEFSFVESPSCIMFWSVKYIFTCKR